VITIVVAGPQGTGKTTLALALGRQLALPVFSRDPLMAALLAGQPRVLRRSLRRRVAAAGLRLQGALLARQLELGQSVILECVAPDRARWRQLTAAAGGRYLAVECVCSDAAVHRERVESRPGVSWRQVAATIRRYQPDPQADVVADAVRPVDDLAAQIASMASPEH
jgi:predicted kinase